MTDDYRRRVAGLLGLGIRARGAVVGLEQVRNAAKANKLAFAAVAYDASKHSLDKVVPLLHARGIPFTLDLSAEALGALAGKPTTAAIGVTDRNLAHGLRKVVQSRSGPGTGSDQAQ